MENRFVKDQKENDKNMIYKIEESVLVSIFLSIGGFLAVAYVLISHFYFNVTWAIGRVSPIELNSSFLVVVCILIVIIAIFNLTTLTKPKYIEIFTGGLNINGNKIAYSDITELKIRKGFFVKVIIKTQTDYFTYKTALFSHKDDQIIRELISFLEN